MIIIGICGGTASGKSTLSQELIEILNNNGITATITGREKTPFSIWRKIQNKKISLEQLTDIIGFRVIVKNIEDCYNGGLNKITAYKELKRKYNLIDSEIAYVGDDLIDIPVMEKVGIPIAVANAITNVKEISTYITKTAGGYGAFRESVSWIIEHQGRMDDVLKTMKEHILKS